LNKQLLLLVFILGISVSGFGQQFISMETTKGEVIFKLYNETPKHKANFLKLIEKNFFDSLMFHRVMKDFMVQTGDPQSRNASRYKQLGGGGPGYNIDAEIDNRFIHKRGALAAARDPDDINPKRRSSGSQFYIVQGRRYPRKYMPKFEEKRGKKYTEEELITYESLGGTPHLDGQYTVFGEVVKGLDVVKEISEQPTNRVNRPLKDVYILNIKLIK
jgi:peptidyl-prolyl cis-trans isomerase B (cyclophilin B)